jgi:hypothetical protein
MVTMDDQQGKTLDLAWLAGFIDGEGTITFKVQRGKRLTNLGFIYYYPDIRITNTHQATLKTCTDILDANGLAYHVSHRGAVTVKKWAAAWDIEVKGLKRCERWLQVIAPYLRTKQEKAYLALEYINSRKNYAIGEGYTERELEILGIIREAPVYPQRLNVSIT